MCLNPRTCRELGLFLLACGFHGPMETTTLTLSHPESEIRRIVIEADPVTLEGPGAAQEQRSTRCSLLDSSCSADRRGCIHAQGISIRRKKVQTVEVYALGAGNRLVNIESAGEALSGPILRLDTVLVDHCK